MSEMAPTVDESAGELARCRRDLAWTRRELDTERRERSAHLQRFRKDLLEQVHQVYRDELAQLKDKLAGERQAHATAVAALKSEFAAKEQAYEAKLRDVVSELAMYKDSGPARSGSEKVSGSKLDSRKKGKGKGRDGHGGGRNIPTTLPTETVSHDLPSTVCPVCGSRLCQVSPAVSHEVHFEVDIKLLRHERQKAAACRCGWSGPATADREDAADSRDNDHETTSADPFVVAPLPPKAMRGTLFSDRSWVEMLVLKYGHQMPLNQIIAMFTSAGYTPNSGTLCDGFARFAERILAPLDHAIIEHNLEADHWAVDDSSLRMINSQNERTHGVVWQVGTRDTTVYMFTDTGEAKHIQTYFAAAAHRCGTVLADRAATYQTLWFSIAFCWAHVRRDFIRLGRYIPGNRTFAMTWLAHIRRLYRLCRSRRLNPDDPKRQNQLAAHIQRMAHERDTELAKDQLPERRRKVLESLENHWQGLTRFLDDPLLPLDNNAVERNFRPLARLRHNCHGCHSERGANTAMRSFTVIRTLQQNGIPLKPYLLAWCDALAENAGRPPDELESWLPWQLDDHVKERIEHFRSA